MESMHTEAVILTLCLELTATEDRLKNALLYWFGVKPELVGCTLR